MSKGIYKLKGALRGTFRANFENFGLKMGFVGQRHLPYFRVSR